MTNDNKHSELGLGANWEVLETWGIVALKKHQFTLDKYASWLAIGCLEYDKFAVHPFNGKSLPWSIVSIVNMNIQSLFEARREDRELSFEPIVLVFKDIESKERFDALAEKNAIF